MPECQRIWNFICRNPKEKKIALPKSSCDYIFFKSPIVCGIRPVHTVTLKVISNLHCSGKNRSVSTEKLTKTENSNLVIAKPTLLLKILPRALFIFTNTYMRSHTMRMRRCWRRVRQKIMRNRHPLQRPHAHHGPRLNRTSYSCHPER